MQEQTQERFFLGIDGGGTKPLAIVVDACGNERGRGWAGGGNHRSAGLPGALRQIEIAVQSALASTGAALPLAGAWVGLAGIDDTTDHAALLPHVQALANTVRLTNDAELLLGALPHAAGVALVAGTGAIALGRDGSNKTARANGWGHIIGDEGSGYAIGRDALRAASRAADGRGPVTPLLEMILHEWQLERPAELIDYVYAHPDKAVIARLAPLVFAAAQEGDAAATHIVHRAAAELAQSALAVARALDLPVKLPLAFGGALLAHNEHFRELVLARLQRLRPAGVTAVVAEPALAAARAMISSQEQRAL